VKFSKLPFYRKTQGQKRFLRLAVVFAILSICPVWASEMGEIRDIDITLAVDRQLETDEAVAANMIAVLTRDGIVTLSGSVENILDRERAADNAAMIKGVRSVINRIEIRPVPRTDAQIRADVQQSLLDDPAFDWFDIHVGVRNEIVVLDGMVDSWQEAKLCELVAKGVVGVKDVKSNIEVSQKSMRPDAEIKAEIERALTYDAWIDDALIDVKVLRGHVILSGTVGSLAEKTRAFGKCWIAGVKAVDSKDLRVDWSRSDEMRRQSEWSLKTGEEIKQALEDVFAYDPRISRFDLGIEVDGGSVILTGKVDNLKAKRVAGQNARNTRGVWLVKNQIKVRPGMGPNTIPMPDVDAEIARRVRIALLRNPDLYQHEISVSVRNGAARLSGTVYSAFEKSLADDLVSRVRGVTMVLNNLTVNHPWSSKEDWEIKKNIEDELRWSPFVDEDDVSVNVTDGVATLVGVVDTLRERRVATENAYEGGAKHVRNHLKVRNGPEVLRP